MILILSDILGIIIIIIIIRFLAKNKMREVIPLCKAISLS